MVAVRVTLKVVESAQTDEEVTYFTAYVPMVEALKSIAPVDALILSPLGVALNVPPLVPVTVGVGSLSVSQ